MGAWAQPLCEARPLVLASRSVRWPGFAGAILLPASTDPTNRRLAYPSPSPHRWLTRCRWYGNIHPFPITYACRPRLRDRLTLGGLPFPRKPWVFGERVFHPFYRYLCRHSHFPALQQSLRSAFDAAGNAPLPPLLTERAAASVPGLSPVGFSAPSHLTSELLRFL